ncbi:Phox homologous domain-containing protein [Rhizophagus diaphanus]|nr:Phox homologous domain-containing protein [Rhizophagus diaphanus] [Rhizophagus sp. MUCL 43196]
MAVVCKILNSGITAGSSVKYFITNGTLDTLSQKPIVYVNSSCKVHIPGWTTRIELFGLGQYISYQIVCRFWTDDGNVNKIIIYKRYTDFYKLHQKLVGKYGSEVIPPLPPKQSKGRFEEDFIELRRVRLEIYLACLAKFYYPELMAFVDGDKKGTKVQTDEGRNLIENRFATKLELKRYNNEKLLKSCLTSSSRRYKRFQVHFSTDVVDNEKASKNPNSLQFMNQNPDITVYYM